MKGTLTNRIELARTENAELIGSLRNKGRHLLIDDQQMIDAYDDFLESGEVYPCDHDRGIWFPESLRAMMGGFDDESHVLNMDLRQKFARDCFEMNECPEWRTRGW